MYSSFHTVCIAGVYISDVLAPVTRSSIAYKLVIFRPSTNGTMPIDYSNFVYSYKMVCNFANNKQKYAKLPIPSLIRIFHYVMPLNYN